MSDGNVERLGVPIEDVDTEELGPCIACGCTEENACEGGCAWASLEPRICTQCVALGKCTDQELLVMANARIGLLLQDNAKLGQESQAMVNILVALVIRSGGVIRMRHAEFEDIHHCRLKSWLDKERNEQVLEVERVDDSGQVKRSKLIVTGRLPLIMP